MDLFVYVKHYDNVETQFVFRDVSVEHDDEKDLITFHPKYCGPALATFEAVKKALIDCDLPF